MRRLIAVVAVASLVAVAGCSGGTGAQPNDATTTSATTAPPETAAGPVHEPPLDADAVATAHLDALSASTTYTIESTFTGGPVDGERTEYTTVIRGDLDSGAVETRLSGGDQTTHAYAFPNGTEYHRLASDGGVSYRATSESVASASEYASGTVASFVGQYDLAYDGTTTVDGERVHVYRAQGVDALNTSSPRYQSLNRSDVDAVNATMRVRPDGVVTTLAYDVTYERDGETVRVQSTQRFAALGATDVSPPDWLDEARANAST